LIAKEKDTIVNATINSTKPGVSVNSVNIKATVIINNIKNICFWANMCKSCSNANNKDRPTATEALTHVLL